MIVSVSAVVNTAFKLFVITVSSGFLTLLLALMFGTGATGRSHRNWCMVYFILTMIISWMVWGHPGVEFVA